MTTRRGGVSEGLALAMVLLTALAAAPSASAQMANDFAGPFQQREQYARGLFGYVNGLVILLDLAAPQVNDEGAKLYKSSRYRACCHHGRRLNLPNLCQLMESRDRGNVAQPGASRDHHYPSIGPEFLRTGWVS